MNLGLEVKNKTPKSFNSKGLLISHYLSAQWDYLNPKCILHISCGCTQQLPWTWVHTNSGFLINWTSKKTKEMKSKPRATKKF